jgi:hypothetical protein
MLTTYIDTLELLGLNSTDGEMNKNAFLAQEALSVLRNGWIFTIIKLDTRLCIGSLETNQL